MGGGPFVDTKNTRGGASRVTLGQANLRCPSENQGGLPIDINHVSLEELIVVFRTRGLAEMILEDSPVVW